ncbi:FAD dependent oxidoreductase family protein [Blastomonas sp. RAC04]|uniref:dihydrolipoyl dehydrogenase n=1 Tax=Blastomonas sp. RAC04 TaxID=1842535 RepID=UPI00083D009C|nr:dihydrolipoyl dehydrogenase [Blastomonas sp. RAC04]AOF99520.1 FAD dependent oxidoreductase family protein [Blastomonas sp. RAC04]
MSEQDRLRCDVVVIGAGTAGLAAERAARANGVSTLLIDPDFSGTTCANVGCMPSKLLIAAAKARHAVDRASQFGIDVGEVSVDGATVMKRVRKERDRFAASTQKSIEKIPDAIRIRGRVMFTAPGKLQLDDGRSIEARTIVIATGSRPALPDAFAALGDSALTNETVFELEALPTRLAVVGSGAIGLEMAQAFARLGVKVALFDKSETMAKLRCPRVHEALKAIIACDVDLHLGVDATPEPAKDGVTMRWSGNSKGKAVFDHVLVAVGRPPVFDGLSIDKAGLDLDDKGVPCHDRATMRCGDSNVFLAGDVAADLPLLHEASHDGAIAGRNAAAYPAPVPTDRYVPFSITFTDPQVVTIGKAEEDGAVSGTADFTDQGRARVEARNKGALTLYAAAPDGVLIGADLVAPAGEHLGHLLAWAIQQKMTATQVLEMPFYHPTIEEGLKQALRTVCAATPIDIPENQDAGSPAGA